MSGDAANLEVVFLTNGQTAAVIGDPATLELQFGVKARGRYDLGYLVHQAVWTMPDPESSPVYQCTPDFNTVELNAAMGVGSPTGSELSEITVMGEITWREGTGPPTSTRTFTVVVENDVNRGTEGVPTDATPAYPAPESIASLSQVVRHDAAQALTADQKTQARSNLGLGSAATSAATAFATADQGRIAEEVFFKVGYNNSTAPFRFLEAYDYVGGMVESAIGTLETPYAPRFLGAVSGYEAVVYIAEPSNLQSLNWIGSG